jgi:hypothetical protein
MLNVAHSKSQNTNSKVSLNLVAMIFGKTCHVQTRKKIFEHSMIHGIFCYMHLNAPTLLCPRHWQIRPLNVISYHRKNISSTASSVLNCVISTLIQKKIKKFVLKNWKYTRPRITLLHFFSLKTGNTRWLAGIAGLSPEFIRRCCENTLIYCCYVVLYGPSSMPNEH